MPLYRDWHSERLEKNYSLSCKEKASYTASFAVTSKLFYLLEVLQETQKFEFIWSCLTHINSCMFFKILERGRKDGIGINMEYGEAARSIYGPGMCGMI